MRKIITLTGALLGLIALGLLVVQKQRDPQMPSIRSSKMQILHGHHHAPIRQPSSVRHKMLAHTEKLGAPLKVRIEGSHEWDVDESFTITGYVTVEQPLTRLDIEWKVPADLQVVSGSLNETLFELDPSEPIKVEILVSSRDIINHQVHFIVSGELGNTEFSGVAQFNTLYQEYINNEKNALLKRNEEYLNKMKSKVFY